MHLKPPTRRRWRGAGLSIACTIGLFVRAASASAILIPRNCRTAPDSLGCRLNGVLDFLYAAAAMLGVVLVVVIVVTIRIYRRNRDDEGLTK
jgi:hypothetical protein